MKKILLLIVMMMPISVLAAGGIDVNTTEIEVEEGKTKTFEIIATNAIGDVTIESSDKEIATVDKSEWETGSVEAGKTVKGTVTVTGKSIGTAVIVIEIDGATFDQEDLQGQTKQVKVNVVESTGETKQTEENPKTGAFLDMTIILIGAAAVYTTFSYVNKRRTMI